MEEEPESPFLFLGGMYHSEGENQSQIQLEEERDVQKSSDNYPLELLQ